MSINLPLLGVKAFVDAKSDHADHSAAVSSVLEKLGAVVYDKLLPNVTHVIFKDGSKSTELKARKLGVHLVSVSWVESCRQSNERSSEHLFRVDLENSTGKRKKKLIQPKTFEAELQDAAMKLAKEKQKKEKHGIEIPATLNIIADRMNLDRVLTHWTPPSLQRKLDRWREEQASGSKPLNSSRTPLRPLHPNEILGNSPELRVSQKEVDKACVIVPMSASRSPSKPGCNYVVPETPLNCRNMQECSSMDLCTTVNSHTPEEKITSSDSMSPTLEWDQNVDSFLNQQISGSPLPPDSRLTAASPAEKNTCNLSSFIPEMILSEDASLPSLDSGVSSNSALDISVTVKKPLKVRRSLGNNLRKKFVSPIRSASKNETKASTPIKIVNSHSDTASFAESSKTPDMSKLNNAFSKLKPPRRSSSVNSVQSSSKPVVSKKIQSASKKSSCSAIILKAKSSDLKLSSGQVNSSHLAANLSLTDEILSSSLKSTVSFSCQSKKSAAVQHSRISKDKPGSKKGKRSKRIVSFMSDTDTSGAGGSVSCSDSNHQQDSDSADRRSSVSLHNSTQDGTEKGNVLVSDDDVWMFDSNNQLETSRKSSASAETLSSSGHNKLTGQPPESRLYLSEINLNHRQSRSSKKPNIVLTSLHSGDRSMVKNIIKKLGSYAINTVVDRDTTHVVCGDGRRTLNVLRGISYGCWIVSVEWVLRSLEEGDWTQDESKYLMTKSFNGCNLTKRQHIRTKGNRLLSSLSSIYIANDVTPPKMDLTRLISLNGGQVVNVRRASKIVITQTATSLKDKRPEIKPSWVLDCVTTQKLLSYVPYMCSSPDSPGSDSDSIESNAVFNS